MARKPGPKKFIPDSVQEAEVVIPDKITLRGEEVVFKPEEEQYDNVSATNVATLPLPAQTIHVHLEEIPPSKSSGLHRHMSEAIIYILSGSGRSEIHGRKVSWKAGDFLYIPPWAWHRHYNPDKKSSVRFLAMTNSPLLRKLGPLNLRIERGYKTYEDVKDDQSLAPQK